MPPPHYRQRPEADWDSRHLCDTMESRRLGGAGGSRSRATDYGNSTFTLKSLWAELVGDCHAASVRFVLPRTVYK